MHSLYEVCFSMSLHPSIALGKISLEEVSFAAYLLKYWRYVLSSKWKTMFYKLLSGLSYTQVQTMI